MAFPLTVAFRNLRSSPTVRAFVRRWSSKLDTACDRIERCTVVIERPHQRHHRGQRYRVRVTLAVPGPDVNVSRDHALDGAHEDLYVAIRDAFRAARRQLEEHVRRERGTSRPAPRRGRVVDRRVVSTKPAVARERRVEPRVMRGAARDARRMRSA